MSTYEGFDRARNRHRYSLEEQPVMRGGARRNFQQPRHTMNYHQQQPFYRGTRFQQPNRYYQSQPIIRISMANELPLVHNSITNRVEAEEHSIEVLECLDNKLLLTLVKDLVEISIQIEVADQDLKQ